MGQPLVSIIISLYNGERVIRETIESALNQTYTTWEMIVVNNASTDRSLDILRSFAKDERIRVIGLKENVQVSMAHQIGNREARGKYLAVLEKDDLWESEKLTKQVKWMEEHPETGVCFTLPEIIDENGETSDDINLEQQFSLKNMSREKWLYHLLTTGNHFCHSSALIRRNILDSVGGYNPVIKITHDYALWLQIVQKSELHVIQEKLTKYRRSKRSCSIAGVHNENFRRTYFEYAWAVGHTIFSMESKLFMSVFRDEIHFPEAQTENEIRIEKALILASELPVANCKCYAFDIFEALFHQPDNVRFLKEKYGITQHDIYRLTGNDILSNCSEEEEYRAIKNERDTLKELLYNSQVTCEAMKASTSWRITGPLRVLTDRLRKNKTFLMIEKGLKSLKHNGLENTFRKVGNRISPPNLNDEQVCYQIWIRQNEFENAAVQSLIYQPMISILLPLENNKTDYLENCVRSLQNQNYSNWELELIIGFLPDEKMTIFLKTVSYDSRIHIRYVDEDGQMINSINKCLLEIHGEFSAFISCRDILAKEALYEVVKLLNVHPEYDLIYSDEDCINSDVKLRYSPFFKPDWSPDTFLSFMYTGNLSVYKTSLFHVAGVMREMSLEAAIYDLALRFTEKSANDRIGHIQKVLCHRIIENITGKTPVSLDDLLMIKQEALSRRGLPGYVEVVQGMDQVRVIYDYPPAAKVSIVIPSKDNPDLLGQCIGSIRTHSVDIDYEIIVVDNGSSEENQAILEVMREKFGFRYIYKPMDFNFSKMCNIGADAANGSLLLFLNDDTEVIHDKWLDRMAGQACQRHAGAIGAKLLYPNSDLIQHCGVVNLGIGPAHSFMGFHDSDIHYFGRNRLDYDLIAVTGACLMVDKKKFVQVRKFDESFPIAYNDVDLCFKLYEAGFYNLIRNDVMLIHYESMSRGLDREDTSKMDRLRYERKCLYCKHPGLEQRDPFYNPNLVQDRDDCKVNLRFE